MLLCVEEFKIFSFHCLVFLTSLNDWVIIIMTGCLCKWMGTLLFLLTWQVRKRMASSFCCLNWLNRTPICNAAARTGLLRTFLVYSSSFIFFVWGHRSQNRSQICSAVDCTSGETTVLIFQARQMLSIVTQVLFLLTFIHLFF